MKAAATYSSKIAVENLTNARPIADAKSILGMIGAAVRKGDRVRITATGDDEDRAVDGLRELVESGLGETIEA